MATDTNYWADSPEWMADASTFRTPEEDWSALVSRMDPFWSVRAPAQDLGQRLRARYLLAAPYMAESMAGTEALEPTFARYLQDYGPARGGTIPGYAAGSGAASDDPYAGLMADLRARARAAADAAITDPGVYAAGVTPGTAEFNRRAWLASQFGPGGEQSQANQLAVAQMLALQRRGPEGQTGAYTGAMGQAIRNALARLQEYRGTTLGKPRESFLDWYLSEG
jgi:hypothetical protein